MYTVSSRDPAPAADQPAADVDPPGHLGAARRPSGARALLALWRPGQWPKNLVVALVPLIDPRLWSVTTLWRTAWAVVVFTVGASMLYAINDIADRHRDRGHPTKRHRPVASGRIPVPVAVLSVLAQAALLIAMLSTQPAVWSWPIVTYLLLGVAYSAKLKHVAVVDVIAIAAGFVLRLLQGHVVVDAPASGWLVTCVFAVCVLLAVGRRRHELDAVGAAHRPALRGYTVQLTDHLMVVSGALTVVAYLLYVHTEAPLGTYAFTAAALSTPFALFGLFRYLQLVVVHRGGGEPVQTLFRDRALVINSALWMVQMAGFLVAARLYPSAP